jgi:hypothetical protein
MCEAPKTSFPYSTSDAHPPPFDQIGVPLPYRDVCDFLKVLPHRFCERMDGHKRGIQLAFFHAINLVWLIPDFLDNAYFEIPAASLAVLNAPTPFAENRSDSSKFRPRS